MKRFKDLKDDPKALERDLAQQASKSAEELPLKREEAQAEQNRLDIEEDRLAQESLAGTSLQPFWMPDPVSITPPESAEVPEEIPPMSAEIDPHTGIPILDPRFPISSQIPDIPEEEEEVISDLKKAAAPPQKGKSGKRMTAPAALDWKDVPNEEELPKELDKYGLDAYRQAQEDAAKEGDIISISSGLSQLLSGIGTGVSGADIKSDQGFYDRWSKEAKAPVRKLEEEQKFKTRKIQQEREAKSLEKKLKLQDPASLESELSRNALLSIQPSLANSSNFKKYSADDIDRVYPFIKDRIKAASKLAQKTQQLQYKNQTRSDRLVTEAQRDLSSYRGRSSNLRKWKEGVVKAERIHEVLGKKNLSPNDVQLFGIHEAALALTSMLKGGVATDSSLKGILPNNFRATEAYLKDWITSKPNAAKLGKYVRMYKKAADRLSSVYQKNIRDAKKYALMSPNVKELGRLDPVRYRELLIQQRFMNDKGELLDLDTPTPSQVAAPKKKAQKSNLTKANVVKVQNKKTGEKAFLKLDALSKYPDYEVID